ncbi:reverse transcriptase domain-containing protein [Tanacetum coccineum]|uniref:Reverse transcriptase domain-containing protein n=1 Tax=Tanacetum coccineum TaxID=301880 RepID=A0ABQ4WH77_9ASTR
MLKRCEDTNLSLNWEKSHFMVKEGIVLGHKISKSGLEVDRAKVEVIAKLPHPTTVKGVRSFLGHAGFYRRFIQDFSKIARPMTHLLEKETPFFFSEECIDSFNTLKRKLTEAPILIAPDWDLPFELMCDASDFAIGAVLGQRKNKHFQPIHYASKTMNEAQTRYTTTEKELLAVVYAFEKVPDHNLLYQKLVYTTIQHQVISFPRRMLKAKTHAGGAYCSKNRLLKFETKRGLRISPPIICPDLKTLIKTNSRTKKSMKHFPLELLVMLRLQDQSTSPLVIRRCVSGQEALDILKACHSGPTGGHQVPKLHSKKVFDSGFFCPPSTRMPMTLSPIVTICQRQKNTQA